MELLNAINDYLANKEINTEVAKDAFETLIKVISPLAPHFAQEQWQILGHTDELYNYSWPEVNEQELKGGMKNIPIQVNGKLKACVSVSTALTPEEMLEEIKKDKKVQSILEGKEIKKEIYVPGKIYNVVI